MDDAESVELEQESLEGYGEPATVYVTARFKTGEKRIVCFRVPCWTPVYGEPITAGSIHAIITSAFSVGDVPFLALPYEDSIMYFDLGAVNSVDVKVDYDNPK